MFGSRDALEFARRLRSDPETMTPAGWVIDWQDAPFPYKTYRDPQRVPLPAFFGSTAGNAAGDVPSPDGAWLGRFLKQTYGLVRIRWNPAGIIKSSPEQPTPLNKSIRRTLRRAVASGGGLYPGEVYVYWRGPNGPARGLYHYDVAHHALIPLRLGDHDAHISACLGERAAVANAWMCLFVSVFFWKNMFKYADFCYRLSAQDAGVVVGQVMTVAEHYRVSVEVDFQFLDTALAHLLGLEPMQESVYAALSVGPRDRAAGSPPAATPATATETAAQLVSRLDRVELVHVERSQQVKRCPPVEAMHRSSLLEQPEDLRRVALPALDIPGGDAQPRLDLPAVSRAVLQRDLHATILRRTSPAESFVPGPIALADLGELLWYTTRPWALDVDAPVDVARRPLVYGLLHQVESVAPGAYAYDPLRHQLVCIRPGDFRELLQRGLLAQNMNLTTTPACMHLVAENDFAIGHLGNRGYRIQQMMAGIMTQRLQYAATALGLAAHPLLGFSVPDIDGVYGLEAHALTTLSQIPLGRMRDGLYIEGTLGP